MLLPELLRGYAQDLARSFEQATVHGLLIAFRLMASPGTNNNEEAKQFRRDHGKRLTMRSGDNNRCASIGLLAQPSRRGLCWSHCRTARSRKAPCRRSPTSEESRSCK